MAPSSEIHRCCRRKQPGRNRLPGPIFSPRQRCACISDMAQIFRHGGLRLRQNICIYRSKKSSDTLKKIKKQTVIPQLPFTGQGKSTCGHSHAEDGKSRLVEPGLRQLLHHSSTINRKHFIHLFNSQKTAVTRSLFCRALLPSYRLRSVSLCTSHHKFQQDKEQCCKNKSDGVLYHFTWWGDRVLPTQK